MIMLISDVHCQFTLIDQQIAHAEEKFNCKLAQVIVLGDLGFFEYELNAYFSKNPQGFLRPVAFIDGNHEDFAALYDLSDKFSKYLQFLPRTSRHQIDGFAMMALGGAAYMDAAVTPQGCEITADQVSACLKYEKGSVDVVLSHDCPQNIGVTNASGFEHYGTPGFSGGLEIAQHLQPRLWFFGHHHRWFDLTCEQTRFIGIAEIWKGYALLQPDGEVIIEKHELPKKLSWWQRFWFKKD